MQSKRAASLAQVIEQKIQDSGRYKALSIKASAMGNDHLPVGDTDTLTAAVNKYADALISNFAGGAEQHLQALSSREVVAAVENALISDRTIGVSARG